MYYSLYYPGNKVLLKKMNTYRLTDFITIWYTVKKHEMPAAGNNQKVFF